MSDEKNVNAGSETSGEQPTPEVESTQVESTPEPSQDAGGAVEQKAGDPCTCADGRPGTYSDQEGQLVCLPNQG